MANQEFLTLFEKPEDTLKSWERKLNHILSNLLSSSYLSISATDVSVTDAGSYFATDNVEFALQYLALISLGARIKVTTVTAGTVNLLASDAGVIICNRGSAMTVNLPTAVSNSGLSFLITNIGAGTVTLDPNLLETIMGESTFDLYQYENICIVSDGTNWYLR